VVAIAIKVVANQGSVRCEQRFNTGTLNLDSDVKHGKSALLAKKTAMIATGITASDNPARVVEQTLPKRPIEGLAFIELLLALLWHARQ
jgi:hypothetical protein